MKSIAEFTNAFESMESAGAEQARRADYNHEWALRAERERDTERAIADRLAEELESLAWLLWGHERPNTTVTLLRHRLQQALAAWKEARSE